MRLADDPSDALLARLGRESEPSIVGAGSHNGKSPGYYWPEGTPALFRYLWPLRSFFPLSSLPCSIPDYGYFTAVLIWSAEEL